MELPVQSGRGNVHFFQLESDSLYFSGTRSESFSESRLCYLQGVILEVRITSQTFQDGLPLVPQQKPCQQLSQLLLSGQCSSCGKLCSNAGSGLELSQSNNIHSRELVCFSAVFQLCLMSLLWLEGRLCHWVHVVPAAKPEIPAVPGARPLRGTQHPNLEAFPGLCMKFSLGLQGRGRSWDCLSWCRVRICSLWGKQMWKWWGLWWVVTVSHWCFPNGQAPDSIHCGRNAQNSSLELFEHFLWGAGGADVTEGLGLAASSAPLWF